MCAAIDFCVPWLSTVTVYVPAPLVELAIARPLRVVTYIDHDLLEMSHIE
jgi:hypothetical protein